ncbi:hypothetical protein [Lewinella sp. LCG006]|uniref:hypothetical protein n=1 Tax=Lewinella sp. LCG006 TaxID=3231911 RepID=UPI0034606133
MLPNHYLFLLLLLPALCWTACEKSIFNPQPAVKVLSPITMTGEGTFGCKINGEVFLHTPKPFDDHITVYYDDFRNTFFVQASSSEGGELKKMVQVYADSLSNEGVYTLKGVIYTEFNDPCTDYPMLNEDYLVLEENYQTEIIHFDPEARIISGTFQFTVVSEECQDTFRITEGRFDMPWVY